MALRRRRSTFKEIVTVLEQQLAFLTGSPTSPVGVGRNRAAQTKGLGPAEASLPPGAQTQEARLPQEPRGWMRTDMQLSACFQKKPQLSTARPLALTKRTLSARMAWRFPACPAVDGPDPVPRRPPRSAGRGRAWSPVCVRSARWMSGHACVHFTQNTAIFSPPPHPPPPGVKPE